jgi:hypothetical protein
MTSLPSAAAMPLAGVADDPRTLILVLTLCGALLLGAVIIAVTQRWRRRADDRLSASDQLATFRELYEEGELSEDEFNSLRKLLGGQMLKEVAPGGGDPARKGQRAPTAEAEAPTGKAVPPNAPLLPPAPSDSQPPPAPPPAPPDEGIRPA